MNGVKVCTTGRIPVSASPPATPIIACSRMPRLITRSGCRALASSNAVAEMSAVTTTSRGSRSSALVTVSVNTVRMSLTVLVMSVVLVLDDRHHDGLAAGVTGGERAVERVMVAAVDGLGRPALYLEPAGDAAGPPEARRAVVDDDRGQPVQPEPAGQGDRLLVAALVELAVADQHDRARGAPLRPQPE